jgi:HEAT repeat protein
MSGHRHLAWGLVAVLLVPAPSLAQGGKADVPFLAQVLAGGKDTAARMEAARRLGDSKDPKALEPLVKAVQDENKSVRWAALEALGDLGDRRALPTILQYLKKKEPYNWGRRVAANALGNLKGPGAVEALIELLKEDDPYVRRNAAMALGKLKDERAIPPLIELLKDGNEWLRKSVQGILVKMAGASVAGSTPRDYQSWMKWYQERRRS